MPTFGSGYGERFDLDSGGQGNSTGGGSLTSGEVLFGNAIGGIGQSPNFTFSSASGALLAQQISTAGTFRIANVGGDDLLAVKSTASTHAVANIGTTALNGHSLRVGIGTSGPAAVLEVRQPTTGTGIIVTSTAGTPFFQAHSTASTVGTLIVGTSLIRPLVGIGTTAPTHPLHIDHSTANSALRITNSSNHLYVGNTTGVASFTLNRDPVTGLAQSTKHTAWQFSMDWDRDAAYIMRGTSGNSPTFSEVLTITGTSFVGINSTAPAGPLQVNHGSTAILTVTTANNVGIGTTAPGDRLDVRKGTSALLTVSTAVTVNIGSSTPRTGFLNIVYPSNVTMAFINSSANSTVLFRTDGANSSRWQILQSTNGTPSTCLTVGANEFGVMGRQQVRPTSYTVAGTTVRTMNSTNTPAAVYTSDVGAQLNALQGVVKTLLMDLHGYGLVTT